MTRNQISYWTLQEDKRKNLAQEKLKDIENQIAQQQASTAKETARIKGEEARIKAKEAETNKQAMDKKVNENVWKPLETISTNAAKVLGGIL